MHKLQHHFLQFALAHLSVAHCDAGARNQFLKFGGNFPDRIHPVVHEIDLAAALQFLLDRRLNQLEIPVRDHGLNRHAVFWRRLDHAHVAQPDQRHVQRPRNRRRRHGEHVHLRPHLLDSFLVAHSEALLLVHHQQTEIGELHVLGEQPMRADQDVHLPRFDLQQDFLDLLCRAEAADHLNRYWERRKPLLEGFVVLEGEYGGRREHSRLLVITDRLERGAHRDFRLAVADIAAQQPVHGQLRFHVTLHVDDGLSLVLGLAEFEGVLKLLHPLGIGRELVALCGLTLRIELQQFVGHVLHRLAHTSLSLGP